MNKLDEKDNISLGPFNDLKIILNKNGNNDLGIKSEIKKILLYNNFLIESDKALEQNNAMNLFLDFFSSLEDELSKEKIKSAIDQLALEVGIEYIDNPRYLLNLFEIASRLKIKRNIYDVALSNIYNFTYIHKKYDNIDIHLKLIKYAASFEVTSDYEKKVLEICNVNLNYPEYAPIAYRWAYEIDHSKAITLMDRMIDLLNRKEASREAILVSLRRVLNMEWIYEIMNKNKKYFINEIIPRMFTFDLMKDFKNEGVELEFYDFDLIDTEPIIKISLNKFNKDILNDLDSYTYDKFYKNSKRELTQAPMLNRPLLESISIYEKLLKEM